MRDGACHRGSCAVRIQCHRRNVGIRKAVFILQAAVFVIYAQLGGVVRGLHRQRKFAGIANDAGRDTAVARAGNLRAGGRLHTITRAAGVIQKVASARFGDRGVVVAVARREHLLCGAVQNRQRRVAHNVQIAVSRAEITYKRGAAGQLRRIAVAKAEADCLCADPVADVFRR